MVVSRLILSRFVCLGLISALSACSTYRDPVDGTAPVAVSAPGKPAVVAAKGHASPLYDLPNPLPARPGDLCWRKPNRPVRGAITSRPWRCWSGRSVLIQTVRRSTWAWPEPTGPEATVHRPGQPLSGACCIVQQVQQCEALAGLCALSGRRNRGICYFWT